MEEEEEDREDFFWGNMKETDLAEMAKKKQSLLQLDKYFEGQATFDNEMFEDLSTQLGDLLSSQKQ